MARNLVRFDPFTGLDITRRDLFDDGFFRALREKLPTTDVYTEDDKALVVEAQLPNFDEKDITVNVDRGELVIQAERHEKEEDKKKVYVEFSPGWTVGKGEFMDEMITLAGGV